MKNRETEPFAYGLLASLTYLLFVCLAVACSSCTTPRAPLIPQTNLPIGIRDAVTVEVRTFCDGVYAGTGSGVMINGRQLLTAYHVVYCNHARVVKVRFNNAVEKVATVEKFWLEHDVARLAIDGNTGPQITVAETKTGDIVCAAVAHPTREQRCGTVEVVYNSPSCASVRTPKGPDNKWCFSISVGFEGTPGNSGGGVYDEQGRLVALVTGGTAIGSILFSFGYLSALSPINSELFK